MYGSFYAMTGLWAGPYFIQGYGLDKGTAGGILFCMALGAVVGPSLVGVVVTWVRWSKGVLLLAASGVTILLAAPLLAEHPRGSPPPCSRSGASPSASSAAGSAASPSPRYKRTSPPKSWARPPG